MRGVPVVSNHMSRDLLFVEPDLPLVDAAQRMHQRGVGAVMVKDGDRLAGILTERDLLRAVADRFSHDARVADWMTASPETIEPDDTTAHAAVLMIHGGFRHLPVVAGANVVGILSIRDLMRVVLDDATPRGV
jgi:signal-transduction protein with cAMP-binding, CBS, and nucleotidyltransferase domain